MRNSHRQSQFCRLLTKRSHRYQARLAARPLLTQAVTTSILFGTGDIIAQQAVDKKGIEKHDLARTGRMALYGGGELHLCTLSSALKHPFPAAPPPSFTSKDQNAPSLKHNDEVSNCASICIPLISFAFSKIP